ncbi:acyl-CoA synthetase (AMP-forming)/AMP-acid ligase II [Belliella baltica DSM 15883]|uniref:Acyl-CoA synthetase (AMP-forming)/AMP-acid ligase II n=1 Tax=Belliella baltica (strain DSM 15883 / CIP 108006 / LMG 21964 / BA134) TaxID=866536 RepID=I3Z6M2_BELBD|nr:AMP-binding protein [Belliella baltica]AFL84890.1 acyl-CoA synthetase (AMP-forming)/AMP-acid ligase II [Belliella baltica DSM 15883]
MGSFIYNNQNYTFEQIKTGNWFIKDDYIDQTFTFCKNWLNDQEEFELQTSGSTGTPKKINISRSQMEVSALATQSFFKIEPDSKLLVCLNTRMIGGKMMLVRGMKWNANIYLTKPEVNPLLLFDENQKIDFCAMVPMQIEACLSDKETAKKLSNIKILIIGGAPSSADLIDRIIQSKINAYQTYGMTETVSHIALAKIEGSELVYRTLPDVRIGTDDENRLWVEAPMAKEKRLQTNDLVQLIDTHSFKWIGRADFTINSGGIKIQAESLEAQLGKYIHPIYGNVSFFVIGQKDQKLGEKVVLFIETSSKEEKKAQELLTNLKENLQKYHCPKNIYFLPEFVKTDSGKINRTKTSQICF